jgi:hypothetical protein
MHSWFGEVFDADLRSLAVFRVVMAVIVLIDLVGKTRNLTAFYTDDGLLPRQVLLQQLRPWSVSLNMVSGTFLVSALLFGITFVAALCLLVGYRSRLSSVVVWAMVLSIQWRNPYVLHAADELLRVLLFWAMFLPLGAMWSLDRFRGATPSRVSSRFVSIGVAGLFLQIAFMYWFAVILKSGREWRTEGTALSYALSADHLASPTGTFLLRFPELLKVLTFGTLAIEVIAPLLLLSPFLKGPLRTIGVGLVICLHLGILVTMNIGYFPLLSAFCVVCFLPGWFWNTALPHLAGAFPPVGHGARYLSSIPGRFRAGALGYLVRSRWQPNPSPVRGGADAAFTPDRVGEHTSERQGKGRLVLHSSVVSNLLAAFFLIYVFIMNITTVTDYDMPLPDYSVPMSVALGLDQRWAMYSPRPAQVSYWFTIPGVLKDGTQVDLLPAAADQEPDRAGPVSWERPPNVNETFRDMYWLRYLTTLTRPDPQERLLHFGGYICRSWNAWYPNGPMQLQTFEIVYFTQPTLPDGDRGEVDNRVIWQHRCR